MADNIYDFEFKAINGQKTIKLNDYKGKLILIVNTASLCGFTKQYAELEEIWQKYKDKGLIVIAIPSNDFGSQEPGSNKEIANFCQVNFNISFLLTEKLPVSGANSHPFFKWTKESFGRLSGPQWNFYKYIISPEGKPAAWFTSFTSPGSAKLIKTIEKNLPKL